ncbi:hypothetical protein [Streptomyces sp. NPDC088725]|uniref:hypothetical protein n=1 Tax=Streptomyces sp. NPDC088725 TaxID=3365873 RepID=UPI0038123980
MSERDWNDDRAYEAAVDRAARATRLGWSVIASVTGLAGCAVAALALAALAVFAYVVMCLSAG